MFSKILVANRGEIAVRILRTIREMGIAGVAVYSDADAGAPHVVAADEAVHIGPAEAAQSYLSIERILEAARATGAQAIHPGYGFLAENAAFARAVTDAGLVFIGPPAEAIATLGDKTAARALMEAHGVPVIPGMATAAGDLESLRVAAEEVGYPVLLKAVAGGGGKGMRVVRAPAELEEAFARATSEAQAAFGDGSVYLERFLDRPRHVEVQVLADGHGTVLHLFERECSVQRRHQKIIEETPSPALDDALRERMCAAAVAAATVAGYVNAGTVEFLLDDSGEFYFLEVNTRLQVEHPITEMVTGIDLVRRQIEIAAGIPLDLRQEDLCQRGHAIECRIYAEDPANDFMPSPGEVLYVRPAEGPGVRFDGGIAAGTVVPVEYDPILGKLVVWAESRPAAIARMVRALRENVVLGVRTLTELLVDVLQSDPFRAGDTYTGLLADAFADWRPAAEGDEAAALGFAAEQLTGAGRGAVSVGEQVAKPVSPWETLGQWDLLD